MSRARAGLKCGKGGSERTKGTGMKGRKPFKKKPASSKPAKSTILHEIKKEKEVKVKVESTVGLKVSAAAMATRKERRAFRRQQHSNFELTRESKVLWEYLRQCKNPAGKTMALEEMVAMGQGHFRELSLKHDTARVVQSTLKFGTPQHRTKVFTELREHIVELSKLKYAKFVVRALLKYCSTEERGHVIRSLYGHVLKLVRHNEACDIVEVAYNDYANAKQRTALVQEFYGTEFALFKDDPSMAERGVGLKEVLVANPTRSKKILRHMRDSLLPLLDKSVVRHSIVHKALVDYLLNSTAEARAEMVEALHEKVVHILHTKDGSRVAMQCVWHGTAKDRKIIIKSFKSLVCKICKEENGHIVLMAIFDSVDDTVLVRKAILSEIKEHLEELCENQFGRRVVLYLLAPRSPQHFSPQFVSLLSPGDENSQSKKPAIVRRKELLEPLTASLLNLATNKVVEWAQCNSHAPLLLEIIIVAQVSGDLSPLYHSLLEFVVCDGSHEAVEVPSVHWLLKRLIDSIDGFVPHLLSCVGPDTLRSWFLQSNRGAFVVCSMLQAGGDIARNVAEALSSIQNKLTISQLTPGQVAVCNHLLD